MGYMGLNHAVEVDMAADLLGQIVGVLEKGLKQKGNQFNPSGAVNVALVLEALVHGDLSETTEGPGLIDRVIEGLDQEIELAASSGWDDEENKKMHIDAYQRLLKLMQKLH